MTAPAEIASRAETIVTTLLQTQYQYQEQIDPATGTYDCDCNSFVGFVLQAVAPKHYALVPQETTQPRPRAFEYYLFFAGLTAASSGGWVRIDQLGDARRGDVLAWRFATIEAGEDTGHVVFVAEPGSVDAEGVVSLLVYDSADGPHFDDTRGSGAGQFPNGVGSGVLRFKVDGDERPIAFLFGPPETGEYSYVTISLGRATAIT
jgi:hypothetical protein